MEYIIISLLTALIGGILGTYLGAKFLYKEQESKTKEVRKIAIKGLNIFKNYAKKGQSFKDAENQFNNDLNVAEKRAILVALHKIGIPLEIPASNAFNISIVNFSTEEIKESDISEMIRQIEKGYCDNLFYLDVENHIIANYKILSLRKIAKRFVSEIIQKSKLMDNQIKYENDLLSKFSYGEIQLLLVFKDRLANDYYYLKSTGEIDQTKIMVLLKEIDAGIWDYILSWDYEAYCSTKSQYEMLTLVKNGLQQQKQV